MESGRLLHAHRPTYRVRRAVAILGIIVGIAGAVSFAVNFGQRWQVSLEASLGAFIALVVYLEASYRKRCFRKGQLPENHAGALRTLGVMGMATGLMIMIAYLTLAIVNNDKLTGESYWINAVWGFLLAKWGIYSLAFADETAQFDNFLALQYPALLVSANSTSVQALAEDDHVYSGLPII